MLVFGVASGTNSLVWGGQLIYLSSMRNVRISWLLLPLLCLFTATFSFHAHAFDSRGNQFIGLTDFSKFTCTKVSGETIFLSPEIVSRIPWNELVASWNAPLSSNAYLKIEVRAMDAHRTTKFYCMGNWSADGKAHPRESVLNQKDADGDVDTDTLILNKSYKRLQLRLTLGGEADGESKHKLKFVGISLTDTTSHPKELKPNRRAWGKTVEVIERSQMGYPNGGVLCSPTTVSMMMNFWSGKLDREDLNKDVPEIVQGVFDPNWHGTGNWAFNVAYAGSFPGMRAYVTRLSSVTELEDWIASGIPVGLSVDYNKLRGRTTDRTSGHLVVCVGFTKTGDAIINDPGTSQNVRKVFPRKDLIAGWGHSKNAVYLIYPLGAKLPDDKFGHWESKRAKKLLSFAKSQH
jgi:hypothetical protein